MKFAWIAEPPFNYVEDGTLTGCDVELARHVWSVLGEAFEPVETEFSQLLPGLQQGFWAVTTGMFATPARAAEASFTLPIWGLRDGLLIRRESRGDIRGYRSLARRKLRLAVLRGQVQEHNARSSGIRADAILVFNTYREAAVAVIEGVVDAYASVERAHLGFLSGESDSELTSVPIPADERGAELGAFACSEPAISERLNSVLSTFLGSPTHTSLLRSFGFSDEEIAARTSL